MPFPGIVSQVAFDDEEFPARFAGVVPLRERWTRAPLYKSTTQRPYNRDARSSLPLALLVRALSIHFLCCNEGRAIGVPMCARAWRYQPSIGNTAVDVRCRDVWGANSPIIA